MFAIGNIFPTFETPIKHQTMQKFTWLFPFWKERYKQA